MPRKLKDCDSALASAVGHRIREWRLRRGMTQSALAHHAGITQGALSNYEMGRRDVPLSTVLAIAGGLEVSLGELLDLGEVIIVRDSLLGRAVQYLQAAAKPEATQAAV